jgi:DnaJ-class molecular chaperone
MGPLTLQQPVQCRDCHGEGNRVCRRRQHQLLEHRVLLSFRLGEVVAQRDKCSRCLGSKITDESRSLDVVILPGCPNGKKIKFRGENDQLVGHVVRRVVGRVTRSTVVFQPEMDAGDVFFLIEQEKHPIFERVDDNNLLMKMKINLSESLTGFKRLVEHLDGRSVVIQHPADQPIVPGESFEGCAFEQRCHTCCPSLRRLGSMKRINNQGMINMETHHTGDLIIEFDVEFPPMNFFNEPHILQVSETSPFVSY